MLYIVFGLILTHTFLFAFLNDRNKKEKEKLFKDIENLFENSKKHRKSFAKALESYKKENNL